MSFSAGLLIGLSAGVILMTAAIAENDKAARERAEQYGVVTINDVPFSVKPMTKESDGGEK